MRNQIKVGAVALIFSFAAMAGGFGALGALAFARIVHAQTHDKPPASPPFCAPMPVIRS